MKKILALLVASMMVFAFAACDLDDTNNSDGGDTPGISQTDDTVDKQNSDDWDDDRNDDRDEKPDDSLPTSGTPVEWPDNDYTKLVPTPDSGGKVLSCGEIGALFAIELKWSMEQGLAYAQLLQDAGFGDDCVEKYEQYGYIDRTANGVNVQLMDLFGVTSLSIMPVEE